MAKSKMEYFVGERDLSKDISSLYVRVQWWLVSLRIEVAQGIFCETRKGEKKISSKNLIRW